MSADSRDSYVRSASEQGAPSSAHALLAESYKSIAADAKIDVTSRLTAATALVSLDRKAAAQSLYGIAADVKIDPTSRLTAATALVPLDRKAAAQSLYGIAADYSNNSSHGNSVTDAYNLRIKALAALIPVDQELAIKTIQAIVMSETYAIYQRGALQQISKIPNVDVQQAAAMLHSVATASIDTEVRLAAARLLQQLLQR